MNNYPNNSLQKKETKREVAPVAQGTLRKQSFWGRTAKEFFGNNPEDGMTIGEYIWFGAVIPLLRMV